MFPREEGIGPVRLLEDKSKVVRPIMFPKDDGMGPLSSLLYTAQFHHSNCFAQGPKKW